ncbi:hypothetical protein [Pengzhenrongella phosphoraccumulans]|uniref:hypothetical protein n=1 Tax=Pengzhenrongella phosphoraccumulans TaxID=3114394 RepID=UPI00388D1C34
MPSLRSRARAPWWGLGAATVLVVLAMAVPAVTCWDVDVTRSFPPLRATWWPRIGPGTAPALLIGAAGITWSITAAHRLPWRALLAGAWLVGVAWMLALALVDGAPGIAGPLNSGYEYLPAARGITDVPAMLHEFIGRIPLGPDGWPTHVAGHPPGALLFFVLLVRVGLGSPVAAGLVVTAVAATTPLAVLVTARALGAQTAARRALPFLVLGPVAIWQAVSADAVFAAVAAWGAAALALGAVRRSAAWSVVAGLVLGYAVMMSYGLVLLGILAVAILLVARSWYPLPFALGAALGLVMVFAALGFAWWEAFPALQDRYWAGAASRRPAAYWLWGNLAALLVASGPVLGAAVACAARDMADAVRRPSAHALGALAAAGFAMVIVADLTLLSKAEVERIWLPFIGWMMLSCAYLPERWRRPGLALQVGFAITVQHLLRTAW